MPSGVCPPSGHRSWIESQFYCKFGKYANEISCDEFDIASGMNIASDMMTSSSPTPMPGPSSSSATMEMSSMATRSTMSSGMTALTPRGCLPPMMANPGFNLSSLPTESCTNTTSDLLTIPANTTQGWLALDLVNAGSVSKLGVSLDAHSMYVYASDGLYVALQEVKVCNPFSNFKEC